MKRQLMCLIATLFILNACTSTGLQPSIAPAKASLAPSGVLKVGVYNGSPTSMIRDAKTGETKGLTLELGQALAKRLGVPVEVKEYPRLAEVINGLKVGEVDFTVTNASPARAMEIDFSQTVISLELGVLVMPSSPLKVVSAMDSAGIVVGVSQGSTSQATLGRELKAATLMPAPTLKAAGELLQAGKISGFATNKAILFELSDQVPQSRVLDGRWGLEHLAIGIPKKREAGLEYLKQFTAEVKTSGLVSQAATRAGLRGTAKD
jgi:polar amino acid transport system substrate-binding protein